MILLSVALILLAIFGAIFGGRFDTKLEQQRWRRQLPGGGAVGRSPQGLA